jgi:uncharacterized protein YegJ (DUF2314 family)
MPSRRLFLLLALLVCCGCGSKPDTLAETGYDQHEMDAAIARARRELGWFLGEMAAGNGSDWSVKVPVADGGKVEHFWLTSIVYRDGKFTGLIGNNPGVVSNVSFGDEWTVGWSQISDWMFVRDGKIHGNYTMRPLLKTLPPEKARQLHAMLAQPQQRVITHNATGYYRSY